MKRFYFASLLGLVIAMPAVAIAQGGPALVQLAPIEQRQVAEGQTFVGTVTPSKRAIIGSAVDGRVVEFAINEGDRVEAKQKLASLLTETISLELVAAEAELELSQQELTELKNGLRPGELEQARARKEAAKAVAEFRDSNRSRVETLYKSRGAATSQQVDEAISLSIAAHEAHREAVAAFDLAVEGTRKERIAQAVARVGIQAAMVEKLQDQIKKHTIISRFAGYVISENTEIGQWVSRGDPVAEVIALDEVDVEAQVVESQIPFVKIGSTVRVTVPAIASRMFSGKVVSIVPEADTRSRTFPVKVRIENEIDEFNQPLLKSGMFAQVALPTGASTDATLVPKDSLVLGGPTPTIWVVDLSTAKLAEDGSGMKVAPAQLVPVTLGVSEEELIQVIGNIPPNRNVVILGNERIRPSRGPEPTMVRWVP